MRRDSALFAFVLVCTSALAACRLTVTTVNVGTKTSLERQLIGELEPLSEEELLAASVRAQGDVGVGSIDDLQARAIAARRRQLFNRDDVNELKELGCLGEGNAALLIGRDCDATRAADVNALATRMVEEENADRAAIIDWALATDASLAPTDRPQVVHVYRELLRERSQPGDWIQEDDGGWKQR